MIENKKKQDQKSEKRAFGSLCCNMCIISQNPKSNMPWHEHSVLRHEESIAKFQGATCGYMSNLCCGMSRQFTMRLKVLMLQYEGLVGEKHFVLFLKV